MYHLECICFGIDNSRSTVIYGWINMNILNLNGYGLQFCIRTGLVRAGSRGSWARVRVGLEVNGPMADYGVSRTPLTVDGEQILPSSYIRNTLQHSEMRNATFERIQ